MGNARWSPSDWTHYASKTTGKSRSSLFRSSSMPEEFDPRKIVCRESVDSATNPASTPIIVALDVTGSMGDIPHKLIQGNLGTLMQELLDRKPVSDPHLLCMAVGDVAFDRAPLQVTQFEADVRIAEQLQKLYLEGGGGGNSYESYQLPWYFAATRTRTDAWLKRKKRGYLFTVGDEEAPPALTPAQIEHVFGDTVTDTLAPQELLALAEQMYDVIHLVIEEGSHYRGHGARVLSSWRALLGQRVVPVADYTCLAEVIVSTIQAMEGHDPAAVATSWGTGRDLVVAHAVKHLPASAKKRIAGTGLHRLT